MPIMTKKQKKQNQHSSQKQSKKKRQNNTHNTAGALLDVCVVLLVLTYLVPSQLPHEYTAFQSGSSLAYSRQETNERRVLNPGLLTSFYLLMHCN